MTIEKCKNPSSLVGRRQQVEGRVWPVGPRLLLPVADDPWGFVEEFREYWTWQLVLQSKSPETEMKPFAD